eukprot:gene20136-22884_t
MKSIRLQSIAADFTKCWAKYMADGKGDAFIKASSVILSQTQKKDGATIAQSVLSSFIVPENSSGGGELKVNEHNGIKVEPNVKVVLGCLSAIRSLQGVDGDGSSKDCLHSVLTGAGGVAKTMVASPRTAEEEALLTDELRCLFLSLETDPLDFAGNARASAGVTTTTAGQRSNYDIMNSFAQHSGDGRKEGPEAKGSGDIVDARLTAKARAALTFGAFRGFPFLSSLPVGPDAVNGFLFKLIKTGNWGSAVHLLQLYPAQVSFSSFDSLVSALIQAQEWDVLSTLLLAVRKVLHERNSNALQKGREGAAPPPEGAEQGPFLLDLPPTELRQKVVSLVHSLMEINVQGALNAAKKLAKDYKLVEIVAQIEEQDMILKFQNDILKNKWQMTIQMLERKSERKKLTFYNLLLQNERYWEAAEAYRSLSLNGTNAVLATRAQLDAQTMRHQTEFLTMAPKLLDSVLVVNDHASLQRAARELGLSLADIPVASATSASLPSDTTPPATPPSSTPAVDTNADVDGDIGSDASINAPSSTVIQDTAVRSVPFKTLLEQLQSDALLAPAVNSSKQKKTNVRPFFNGRYRQVVGLDGEWRARMHRDLTQFGCSILQIAAQNRVYILDFRSLCPDVELQPRYSRSTSAASSPRTPVRSNAGRPGTPGSSPRATYTSPEELRDQTRNFLHSLMSDPEVLKVGWDFLSEDIRMLRKNSKGVFTKAMGALNSYLEIKDAGPFILQQEARSNKKKKEDATRENYAANVASLSGACEEFLGKPLLKFEQ